MRFYSSTLSGVILLTFACGLPAAVYAECRPPPSISLGGGGSGCYFGTPQQIDACRRQEQQERYDQAAGWQNQYLACQERERVVQQQAAQRAAQEAERIRQQEEVQRKAVAAEVERKRVAAEKARYIAEQEARRAAAERDRQRAEVEKAQFSAEAEQARRRGNSSTTGIDWGTSVTGGSISVFGLFVILLLKTLKEFYHAHIPRKWRFLGYVLPGVVEVIIYFAFGIEIHEPTIADFAKINGPMALAAATGFIVHHSAG